MKNEEAIDLASEMESALQLLSRSKSVFIFSHVNPDPDAYGSSCGLQKLLQANDPQKTVTVFNPDGVLERQAYIPGVREVLHEIDKEGKPDLIVVCDCGELYRVGDEFEQWISASEVPVLNVDHHQSNPLFGSVNFVRTDTSSTSELFVDLYLQWKEQDPTLVLPKEACDCWLAGILGDTGGFRYRSASAETLKKAAMLVEQGGRMNELTQHLFGSVPMATLKLQSRAVEQMRVCENGAIVGSCIRQEDYEATGSCSEDADNLVELLRDIEGVVISYTLRWLDGKWKASLRTVSEEIDLATVAKDFGGGGHRAAAAFRIGGDLEEIAERLEAKLQGAYLSVKR